MPPAITCAWRCAMPDRWCFTFLNLKRTSLMWWGSTHWSNVAANHLGVWTAPQSTLMTTCSQLTFLFVLNFSYYFFTWTRRKLVEKDLGLSLFRHCQPCDEFSLWWRFVGDTLNPLTAMSLQNCLFPREAFDQQLVFALFHPQPAIIHYYFSEHHSLLFPSAAVYTQLCLFSLTPLRLPQVKNLV